MNTDIVDVVIRHPKERKSKCSLTPLEGRDDLTFFRARPGWTFDGTGYVVLAVDAPVLSQDDASMPLLLLDSTWRLLPQLNACVTGKPIYRSLPRVRTAYPRVSKIAEDPLGGLASVEALYFARLLVGRVDASLLDAYHWRSEFMENLSVWS